eukprot:6176980-Pleurochrysis_carterae.AAC.6
MSRTYLYGHSPNQSFVAYNGSATGSDHSLDAPIMCKAFSNAHDHVGQINDPGVRNQVVPGLSWDAQGTLGGSHSGCIASIYATSTAM